MTRDDLRQLVADIQARQMEPPRFDDRRSSFWVTIRNHTLMNPTAIAWPNQFADRTINDRQRLALVYFRQRGQIANADYRRLNHVDSTVAGQELRGLVQQGLVAQDGVGRGTTYRLLAVDDANAPAAGDSSPEIAVLSLVQSRGAVTSGDCQALLGLNKDQTYRLLSKLSQDGRLKAVGHGRWRRYTAP